MAARFIASADTMRRHIGSPIEPFERTQHADFIRALRRTLGYRFRQEFRDGRKRSQEAMQDDLIKLSLVR